MKTGAGPAALYPSKRAVVASLPDRPRPSCQTSNSPRKLSDQPSTLSKNKRRQHPTGSGNHHGVLYATKLELTMLLLCYPAETAPSRDYSLFTAETLEACCLARSLYTIRLLLRRFTRHHPVASAAGGPRNCSPVDSHRNYNSSWSMADESNASQLALQTSVSFSQ